MRIESLEKAMAVPVSNGNQNLSAIRRQLQMLEQEHNRLSGKKDLTESEQKRMKQIEQEIEKLRQQMQQMEEKGRGENQMARQHRAEPGKGEHVDEWR